jgi:hypothetical protein
MVDIKQYRKKVRDLLQEIHGYDISNSNKGIEGQIIIATHNLLQTTHHPLSDRRRAHHNPSHYPQIRLDRFSGDFITCRYDHVCHFDRLLWNIVSYQFGR